MNGNAFRFLSLCLVSCSARERTIQESHAVRSFRFELCFVVQWAIVACLLAGVAFRHLPHESPSTGILGLAFVVIVFLRLVPMSWYFCLDFCHVIKDMSRKRASFSEYHFCICHSLPIRDTEATSRRNIHTPFPIL